MLVESCATFADGILAGVLHGPSAPRTTIRLWAPTGVDALENEKDMPDSSARPASEFLECWKAEPSLREDGGAVFHALSAAALLNLQAQPSDNVAEPHQVYHSALGLLIALFRAERAFLFEVRDGEKSAVTVGAPLASRDLDGEPVSQPERRVPTDFLRKVLDARCPLASGPSGEQPPADSPALGGARVLGIPVEAGGKLRGLLYLENRFQPLEQSREAWRLVRAYTAVLGSVLEILKIRKENETLWADVTRLQEARTQEIVAAEPPRRKENRNAKRTDLKGDYSLIIGSSTKMLEIFQILDRISSSSAAVLINGESGTGKELIANAIHQNSPRRGKVFVSENCGALTETLLESELFGYVKGAFTGAGKDHKGLFELAVGGTLFLDEVGDMSPTMQKKLLRVLQESIIRRVGGKDYIPVDVRIISATNKDLLEEVKAGNFREDLYYRLNVINIKSPPLRDRKEDIPELVEHFLAELARETGVQKAIAPGVLQRMVQHAWPGNIRELRNEIKRLHALSDGDIRVSDLSESVLVGDKKGLTFGDLERQLSSMTLKEATEELEKELIRNAMVQCRGNKSLMAKMLQVPKTSLYTKISKYGLDRF